MAFPASSGVLAATLASACAQATRVKQFFTQLRTDSAAGSVDRTRVVTALQVLSGALTVWNVARSTPGIVAYAQDQLGSPSLDVSAEFTAMTNAAVSLRDWIFANFPKDAASGAWLVSSYEATGTAGPLTFTSAQLTQFRANTDTLLATIA